ncbi:MAG: undecaprenyl-diphosphate phosphatase, partial [Litorimonas sp.]
ILLAVIQGLTEFLPVSSSAHLILPSQVLGWQDQGAMIDLMAHFGTLFAVLAYFRKDVAGMVLGFFDLLKTRLNVNSVLALNLILATPPVLVIGALIEFGGFDAALRSPFVIAVAFMVFGVVLWVSDVKGKKTQSVDDLSWKGAVFMGLAQTLALIPGTSRSGITMTAALSMGLTRSESARFSMLMSLPVIGVSGLYAVYKLASEGGGNASLSAGLIVASLSFVVAFATIAVFMKYVPKIGMFPFMIYRLVLGALLLLWLGLT